MTKKKIFKSKNKKKKKRKKKEKKITRTLRKTQISDIE